MKKLKRISDLSPDKANANLHTRRGAAMMKDSIAECGFGDSLTVDKNGVIISGNQRAETLKELNLQDAIVVPSDGTRPIIHQRIDLEASEPKAKKLGLLSNRVGEVNLDWNPDVLSALKSELDLSKLFDENELGGIIGFGDLSYEQFKELKPPPGMLWVLIGVSVSKYGAIREQIERLQAQADIMVQTTRDAAHQNQDG